MTHPVLLPPRDEPQLDPLPLSSIRRICVSLPPPLIQRLDMQRGKLTRSYVVKCAIETLLDQVEKIRSRERLLEVSKRLA